MLENESLKYKISQALNVPVKMSIGREIDVLIHSDDSFKKLVSLFYLYFQDSMKRLNLMKSV